MTVTNIKTKLKAAFPKIKNILFGGKSGIAATVTALVIMIIIQCVVIGINEGSFVSIFPKLFKSWLNILRNNTYTGVIALGMCFVVVSGGIDLSVGSLTCAVGAVLMYLIDSGSGLLARMGIHGVPAYIVAVIAALAAGLLLGEVNGLLVSAGKIPPFIATLGTMLIFRSVTQQLTKQFNPVIPAGFKQIASLKIGGQVFLPILYFVLIALIMHVIYTKTAFGKKTVAVGSNERAAIYSGINVKSVKRRVYAISGVMCGIAALIYVARIGAMDFSNAGNGYEMESIAAVVVGGTSMAGGKGSIVGAFLGMLIIGAMNNVLNMLGVPTFLCDAVRGAIIIFAVLVQRRDRTVDNK
ncbi:MAG: ABC transporter permease [Clostridiales bacterium]|nr:ABC transporter permease [Clostridiales bacterium]